MERRWIETAAIAIDRLEALAPGGSVLAKRAEIASQFGLTKESLHNYIEALRFVEEVERSSPEAAAALRTLSATAVALYGRWWRRDAERALAHAIAAAREGWSQARIAADEKKDRLAGSSSDLVDVALSGVTARHREDVSPVLRQAFGHLRAKAPPLQVLRRRRTRTELSRAMGAVDALVLDLDADRGWGAVPGWLRVDPAVAMGEGVELIVLMKADRGAPGDAHRRNARNLVARAALAARVHAMAVVLLPDREAIAEFVAAMPVLSVHALAGDGTIEIFGFGEGSGLVAVASAPDFAVAWSGAAG